MSNVIDDMEAALVTLQAIYDDIVVGDDARLAAELQRRMPDMSPRARDMLTAAVIELLCDLSSGDCAAERALVAARHNNPRNRFVRGFGRDTALPIRIDDVVFHAGGWRCSTLLMQPVYEFKDGSRLVPQSRNRGWMVVPCH